MNGTRVVVLLALVSLFASLSGQAQQSGSPAATGTNTAAAEAARSSGSTQPASGTVVPRLVQFSGTVTDASGKAATGMVAITFSLYTLQDGGTPLWSETQTVALDSQGRYTTFLGAASAEGLPLDLFTSGSARWLGVAPSLPGIGEQPRVLLVGVPYALKAADADTLGGKPASAFVTNDNGTAGPAALGSAGAGSVLAPSLGNAAVKGGAATANGKTKTPATNVTGSGTANYVPLWTGSTTLGNSALFQSGSGTAAKVSIGTTSPTNVFQVYGPTPILSSGSGAGLEFQDRAGGSSPYGEWYSTGSVARFWRSDKGDVLGITSNGYMGIGTTSPSVNLQVAGTTSTSNIQVRASNLATSGSSLSYVGADANAGKTVTIVGADGLGTGPMKTASGFFGTYTNQPAGIVTNNVERMRVTTSGQVGIGTTSPAATLEVNGTAKFDQAVTFAASQTFPNTASLGSNTFVGNQAVTGNVSATGSISGATAAFTGNSSAAVASVTQSGSGAAISATNTAASGETFGVYGFSSSSVGAGVSGTAVSSSVEGGTVGGSYPFGVWGDTSVGTSTNLAAGVVGTADDNDAIQGWNNSPGGLPTAYFENDESTAGTLPVLQTFGGTWAGSCTIDVKGDLKCSGSKSAVVPVDNGQRRVALYAVEAPQNWFEDFGSGQLASGSATVRLDQTFAQTVDTGTEYHVFLTPKGDCEGLYVTNETGSSFEVHELKSGRSNVAFDYRIVALRKGYENVRLADETEQWKQMLSRVPKRTMNHVKSQQPPLPQPVSPVKADVKLTNVASNK
jgi:hypothetical protein